MPCDFCSTPYEFYEHLCTRNEIGIIIIKCDDDSERVQKTTVCDDCFLQLDKLSTKIFNGNALIFGLSTDGKLSCHTSDEFVYEKGWLYVVKPNRFYDSDVLQNIFSNHFEYKLEKLGDIMEHDDYLVFADSGDVFALTPPYDDVFDDLKNIYPEEKVYMTASCSHANIYSKLANKEYKDMFDENEWIKCEELIYEKIDYIESHRRLFTINDEFKKWLASHIDAKIEKLLIYRVRIDTM